MKREGGVSKVPCKVNGLNLEFIFDTGASDVTISLTEATFMLKNGYLSKNDIIGKEQYQTASGDISEGYQIILREIEIAGLRLYNIKASIIRSSNAPLLLGQSALSKLGEITMNLQNNTLVIKKASPVSESSKPVRTIENYSQPTNNISAYLDLDKMKRYEYSGGSLVENEIFLKPFYDNTAYHLKVNDETLKKAVLLILNNNSGTNKNHKKDYYFSFADNHLIIDANSVGNFSKKVVATRDAVNLRFLSSLSYEPHYPEFVTLDVKVQGNNIANNYEIDSNYDYISKTGLYYNNSWISTSIALYMRGYFDTKHVSTILTRCLVELSKRAGNKLPVKVNK